MEALRSLLFALVFYGGTLFAVLGALPVALAGRRPLRGYAKGWARFHRASAAAILGIRSRIEGAPPTGSVLVAAKHQSMFETLEMLLLLDHPAVVVKRQLADLPLFGWAMRRYGVIAVDRSAGAAALRRMMGEASAAVAEGRPGSAHRCASSLSPAA